MKKSKNVQTLSQTIKNTLYMLRIVANKRNGKTFLTINGIRSLLNAFLPLFITLFPGIIINELIGQKRIHVISISVICLLFSPILSQLVQIFLERKLIKLRLQLKNSLDKDFYIHLSHVDFEYRENPEIELKSGRAKDTLQNSLNIVMQFYGLLTALFSAIAILSVVSTLNPLIILLIVSTMIINSRITKHVQKKQHSIKLEKDRLSRYDLVFRNPLEQYLYAKEMKLYHLTDYMIEKKEEISIQDNKLNLQMNSTRSKAVKSKFVCKFRNTI